MTEERMQEVLLGLVGGSQLEIINENKPIPVTAQELKIFRIIVSELIAENYGIPS
jgi:hypothetical protein